MDLSDYIEEEETTMDEQLAEVLITVKTIETKIDLLDQRKLDVTIHAKDLEFIDYRMKQVVDSVNKITGYAKWGTGIVVASVLTALAQFIINGGIAK